MIDAGPLTFATAAQSEREAAEDGIRAYLRIVVNEFLLLGLVYAECEISERRRTSTYCVDVATEHGDHDSTE